MTPTTRSGKDFLPRGFSADDLKLAQWFLKIVATVYPGPLTATMPVPDKQGLRKPTSLSALFHEQWPPVAMIDILTALACAGFITPPQRVKESATDTESDGYSFRLVSRGRSTKPRPGRKDLEGERRRRREVG